MVRRRARGFTRLSSIRTVIILIAGKLDFGTLNATPMPLNPLKIQQRLNLKDGKRTFGTRKLRTSGPGHAWPRNDISVAGLEENDSECRMVTFLFHLSAVITNAVIAELTEPLGHRIDIRVEAPSTGWLFHPDQIKWIAAAARQAFELAVRDFPASTLWRVLYAGPARSL